MNGSSNAAELIKRLRDQAQAPGHVWTDVMRLLLEAADEIERMSKEQRLPPLCPDALHMWFPKEGDGPMICMACGARAFRVTAPHHGTP